MLAYQIERRVHAAFSDRRAQGEWFSATAQEIVPVLTRLIGLAETAQARWVRDGYLSWSPAPKSNKSHRKLYGDPP